MPSASCLRLRAFEAFAPDESLAKCNRSTRIGESANLRLEVECGQGTRLWLEFHDARTLADARAALAQKLPLKFLVGDGSEGDGLEQYAYAAIVDVEPRSGQVSVGVAAVGLPPVFHGSDTLGAWISTPFWPRHPSPGPVDPGAIADCIRWGHPVDGRTLFWNTRVAPAGGRVVLTEGRMRGIPGPPSLFDVQRPDLQTLSDRGLIAAQVAAFEAAIARIPTQDAVVSLSGGLDSRTVLAALLSAGRPVRAVTLAGHPDALDKRLAESYCAAAGVPHETVLLGDEFAAQAPDLALQAARVCPGVPTLGQIADVYLYGKCAQPVATRITGNLGNQTGRGGVEGFTANAASGHPYSGEVRRALAERPLAPWFLARMQHGNFPRVLFEQEVAYWSIANYSVGSFYALQVAPYADGELIQISAERFRRDPELASPNLVSMRRRDLRHRLSGPPVEQSFQRQLLIQRGRRGAAIPMNWGWLAVPGRAYGWMVPVGRTALHAALQKIGSMNSRLGAPCWKLASVVGIPSTLIGWKALFATTLKPLVCDALGSQAVRESGAFESAELAQVKDEFSSGRMPAGSIAGVAGIALSIMGAHEGRSGA